MSDFELYVFFLCLIVFTLLTALFTYLIAVILRQSIRLIRAGLEDDAIEKAFRRQKPQKAAIKVLDCLVSTVICVALLVAFLFSLYINLQDGTYIPGFPTLKVVTSSSMASKYERNSYLYENNLNDQVKVYDLLLTYAVPQEDELELYDIVIYEIDGKMVLHRITGIEEPNESHPDQRYFLCQGDALERPDRFPVLYSQMRGIYAGERIPFVGSFILFMQSPAGWLCILLVIFALVATPILEKHIRLEEQKRLEYLGLVPQPKESITAK